MDFSLDHLPANLRGGLHICRMRDVGPFEGMPEQPRGTPKRSSRSASIWNRPSSHEALYGVLFRKG